MYQHYHKSSDCFEYPQKSLLKSSHPKNPTIENFKPHKIPSIIPITWNLECPPPPPPPLVQGCPGWQTTSLGLCLILLVSNNIAVSQCLTSLISIFLGPSLSAVAANALSTSSAKAKAKVQNTVTETIFIIDFLKVISSFSSKTQRKGLLSPAARQIYRRNFPPVA